MRAVYVEEFDQSYHTVIEGRSQGSPQILVRRRLWTLPACSFTEADAALGRQPVAAAHRFCGVDFCTPQP